MFPAPLIDIYVAQGNTMLRLFCIALSLAPFLSGCAIPFMIVIALQGEGQRVSRIEILDDNASFCGAAITTFKDGFQGFQTLSASFTNLSYINKNSVTAQSRRLSATPPDLI